MSGVPIQAGPDLEDDIAEAKARLAAMKGELAQRIQAELLIEHACGRIEKSAWDRGDHVTASLVETIRAATTALVGGRAF